MAEPTRAEVEAAIRRSERWSYPLTEAQRETLRGALPAPADDPDVEARRKRNAALRDRRLRKLRRAQALARRWEAEDPDVTMRDIVDALLRPSPPLPHHRGPHG